MAFLAWSVLAYCDAVAAVPVGINVHRYCYFDSCPPTDGTRCLGCTEGKAVRFIIYDKRPLIGFRQDNLLSSRLILPGLRNFNLLFYGIDVAPSSFARLRVP